MSVAKDPNNRSTLAAPRLSTDDQTALQQLNDKLQVVLDRVVGVVEGYTTGLILSGRGGTGKSWNVREKLDRLKAHFVLHNSHLTARGLFKELAGNPDAIHLIEDAEALTRNQTALGLLRSATWATLRDGKGRPERHITWQTDRESSDKIFTGGIILITNRDIGRMPEMQALATRVPHINFEVSNAEIAALMRDIALRGYRRGHSRLAAAACLEVAEFIIDESKQTSCPLDMRMLVIGFADRLQAEGGHAGCSWRDLVRSLLRGRPTIVGDVVPIGKRDRDKARELAVAREIVDLDPKDRLRVWEQKAQKGKSAMYRRLDELKQIEAAGQEG